MPSALEKMKKLAKKGNGSFSGLIALKDPNKRLPDGSSMSLAIRYNKWFLAYQKSEMDPMQSYEFDHGTRLIKLNDRPGEPKDVRQMGRLIEYFLGSMNDNDFITILDANKS